MNSERPPGTLVPAEEVQIIDTHLIPSHDPFVVYWDITDLSLFPSNVSTSCLSIMNTQYPAIASSVTAQSYSPLTSRPTSSLPDHGDQPHSLPNAVIAEVAVGATTVFIAIVFPICLVFRYQRRRRRLRARPRPDLLGDGLGELDATHTQTFKRWFGKKWRAELGPGEGGTRTELDGRGLARNGPIFELDSVSIPESIGKPDAVGHNRTAGDDAEERTQKEEVSAREYLSEDPDEAGLASPASTRLTVATPNLVSPLGSDQ